MSQVISGAYGPSREWGMWAKSVVRYVGQIGSGAYGPRREGSMWDCGSSREWDMLDRLL